ncbi:hypothetical protein Xcab_00392 [Xenorhabdus cabanillasii JM26]|nr:hypothetical protein Xcab_00392 [Xenorhabdus cabanillasii JM26]
MKDISIIKDNSRNLEASFNQITKLILLCEKTAYM